LSKSGCTNIISHINMTLLSYDAEIVQKCVEYCKNISQKN